MSKILGTRFFSADAVRVAKNLVGCYIVRKRRGKLDRLMINEVEAYGGEKDRASHARFGKTKRNAVMFGKAGRFYVYFVYGNHWLLNVVTGKDGDPQAVLIRGAGEVSGPGRLTKALKITGAFSGRVAGQKTGLWFEKGENTPSGRISRLPRIGVDYAGPIWAKKLYRFVLKKSAPTLSDVGRG